MKALPYGLTILKKLTLNCLIVNIVELAVTGLIFVCDICLPPFDFIHLCH